MAEVTMKNIRNKLLVWVLTCIFLQFAAMSPVFSFSIGEEREVGEKLLYSVRSAFELVDDPDITQYITGLGKEVLEVAGIQYFDYHFFVIADREINAFAAPSGLIFFNAGLIEIMNSEDELVSVLAHEIGHIDKRHLASRVEKGTYSGIASLGMALAAIAFGGAATPVLFTGALAAGQSLNLHFSRQHEEEADLLSYEWMKKMQRDPTGQTKMLESLRRIARYRSEKLPQYLLTHPNPEARLDYIESLLENAPRDENEHLPPRDDFDFLRFKYRVLASVKGPEALKPVLATVVADGRSSASQKAMAYYGLSQIASTENDYTRSLELLEKTARHYPDKNILRADRGAVLLAAGELSEAEKCLREALEQDNSDMYAMFLLGKLLYRSHRAAEAEKFFLTVSYELPEYAKVYFELGQISADKGRKGVAAVYLGKFHLYQGKLKLAEQSLKNALGDDNLPDALKIECRDLLKKITLLKK